MRQIPTPRLRTLTVATAAALLAIGAAGCGAPDPSAGAAPEPAVAPAPPPAAPDPALADPGAEPDPAMLAASAPAEAPSPDADAATPDAGTGAAQRAAEEVWGHVRDAGSAPQTAEAWEAALARADLVGDVDVSLAASDGQVFLETMIAGRSCILGYADVPAAAGTGTPTASVACPS